MKARLTAGVGLTMLLSGVTSAEKLSDEFRAAFEKTFRRHRTYAVVVRDRVPTTSVYGTKGDQTDAHYSIDIIDGEWKASEGLFDFNQEAVDYLDKGEVMELADISYKDNRVDLRFVSVESKKVRRTGGLFRTEKREPVATNFKFFFPVPKSAALTSKDMPAVLEYIQAYLTPFPDERSARGYAARITTGQIGPREGAPSRTRTGETATVKKEIKVGMTELEVVNILGKPEKELTFGNSVRWTYPDVTVIFESGRVKEVKF